MTEYKGLLHFETFDSATNPSGDLVAVLEAIPTGSQSIFMHSNTSGCIPAFQGLTGSSLTVRYWTVRYDKPTDTGSTISNLPSGISSCGSLAATDAGGSTKSDGGAPGTGHAQADGTHAHNFAYQYTHSHVGSVFTLTNNGSAAIGSVAINLSVIYI